MVGQHIVLGHCSLRLETMLDGTINVIMRPPPTFFRGFSPSLSTFLNEPAIFNYKLCRAMIETLACREV